MIRGNLIKKPPNREAHFEASIHNRFDIEVVDVATGKIKETAVAYNIICDKLWAVLTSGKSYFSYIQYGRGSGTPAASDTSLFSRISDASAGTATYSFDYETGVFSVRRGIKLTASTAVGETITEVGIASASGNGNLCTHAMLQDMNGNQISILKTDLDVLNIYATVFVHFNPFGYDNGSIKLCMYDYQNSLLGRFAGISGNNLPTYAYMCTSHGMSTTSVSGGIAPLDVDATSWSSMIYTSVSSTWNLSNKTLTLKAGRLEASSGNRGGIVRICMSYHDGGFYWYSYPLLLLYPGGSWFPSSNVTNEAVGTGDGVTKDFALDFPYAHDLKAYIDGVETTEFTLDYAPKDYGNDSNEYGYSLQMQWLNIASTPDNHIPSLSDTAKGGNFKGTRIFYNPAHELGIGKIYIGYNVTAYASNDLKTWVQVGTTGALNYTVPAEYQHYRYWKGVSTSDSGTFATTMKPPSTYVGKALHLNNPPPEGAVITADYHSDCIAKDANHVFDFSAVIHFGEYTEAE